MGIQDNRRGAGVARWSLIKRVPVLAFPQRLCAVQEPVPVLSGGGVLAV